MRSAIVVGAGINGLATARGLLRRGWKVTVLERGPVPNPEAASTDAHRLIRAHYPGRPVACRRIGPALAAWDALWRDLGAAHLEPTGMIALSRAEGDWTDRARATFAEAGVLHEVVPAGEIARRFPHLEPGGVRYALRTASGGALMAGDILAGLARWLAARGAEIRAGTPALAADPAGIVETPSGRLEADFVLLAAGTGLPALCPLPLPPLVPQRCVVVWAEIPDDLRPLWRDAPCWTDLGLEEDLWGMPPMRGLPAKLGSGPHTVPGDPETGRGVTEADTAAILGAYVGRLRGAERFRAVRTAANFYMLAPESRFHLAAEGRLAALAADSGHAFKFGALTGEEVAEGIDTGRLAEAAARLAAI